MGNDTSLIIPVAEAAFIQPFPQLNLHRHITMRAPFKQLHELLEHDYHALTTLCASFSPFPFTLARLARFAESGVLYLEPEPTEPFLAVYQALYARYPEPVAKHPTVDFHLTIVHQQSSDLDRLEAEFYRSYGACLPIQAVATELSLYEKREERWFKETSFPFGQGTVA
jgi:hypothetical protein